MSDKKTLNLHHFIIICTISSKNDADFFFNEVEKH